MNTIGSFTGQAAGDFIDGNPFNSRAAIAGSIGGTAGSRIGDKVFGSGVGKKLFGPIACEYIPCMFIAIIFVLSTGLENSLTSKKCHFNTHVVSIYLYQVAY